MSVLRTVRKRKKVRKLGSVTIIRREAYADLELDAKVELIRSLIPLGLMHVQELLDQEVTALASERYARKDASVSGRRHGSNPGTVGLAGQRVPIRVPRIRRVAGSEIPLRSYEAVRGDRDVDDLLLRRVLYISCRNYAAAAAAIPGAIGLSSSTVSRGFIQASAAQLRAFQKRDLSGEDVVAVFLDGKTFADATMVIALGITTGGGETLPGLRRNGHGERHGADAVLAVHLIERDSRRLPGRAGHPRWWHGSARPFGRPSVMTGPGPTVPVAQARERGELPGQGRADGVAAAPPARLQPTGLRRGPRGARDAPRSSWTSGTNRQPTAWHEGLDDLPDATSIASCTGCWAGR